MIITRLVLENFGSFFERQNIEFPTSGFFLISGPTGSGKTTILEAICFALFGIVPRYKHFDIKETYSLIQSKVKVQHGLGKKKSPYVQLEFILSEKMYKITREIQTTKDNNACNIRYICEDKVITTKVKEYESQICRLFGVDQIQKAYKTFTKSVFLPQNAFDEFIYLPPSERKNTIFNILSLNFYEQIKQKIKQEYEKISKQIEDIKIQKQLKEKQIEQLSKKVSDKSKELLEEEKQRLKQYQSILNKLNSYIPHELIENIRQSIRIIEEISQTKVLSDQEYKQINQLHNDLLVHFGILQNLKNTYRYIISCLNNNQNTIMGYLELKYRKQLEIIENQQKIGDLEKSIEEIEHNIKKVQLELDQVKAELNQALTEKEKIENEIKIKQNNLEIEDLVVKIKEKIIKDNLGKCIVCNSVLNQENYEYISKTIDQSNKSILQQELKKLEQKLNHIQEIIKNKENRQKQLEKEYDILNDKKQDKNIELENKIKQQEKIKNELDQIKQENSTSIEQKLLDAISLLGIYQQNQQDSIYQTLEAKITALQKFKEYFNKISDLNIKIYESIIKHLENILSNIGEHDVLKPNQRQELTKLVDSYKKEEILDKFMIDELNKKLTKPSKISDYQSIITNISSQINSIIKILSYKKQVIENLANKKNQLDTLLKNIKHDLSKLEKIKVSKHIDTMIQEIISDAQGIQIDQQREYSNLIECLSGICKKLLSLSSRVESKLQEIETKIAQIEEEIRIYRDIENLEKEISDLEKQIQDIRKEQEPLEILNNDFSPPPSRIGVTDFVFSLAFEIIMDHANKKLYELTEGRYELVCKESDSDLIVLDNWYGESRTAKSLSGGEKFLLSLSLAMAISDIVSYSKHKTLARSIFIDEGFGTLDINTLNYVIDYLENYFYSHSNNVLGVITHVEQIKHRFPYVINVYNTQKGSVIKYGNDLNL